MTIEMKLGKASRKTLRVAKHLLPANAIITDKHILYDNNNIKDCVSSRNL
jgi:hypothetical protein